MTNVVQGDFGRKPKPALFDRSGFVEARGSDFMVATRSGSFSGWFSEAPDWLCVRVAQVFRAMDHSIGGDVSCGVERACYDDKTGTELDVEISGGFLSCTDVRLEEMAYMVNDEHEMFVVDVRLLEDRDPRASA